MLFLLVILEEERLVDWDKEELEAVSAFSFLLRMLASLELFKVYSVQEDKYTFLEIAYPQENSSILQIFPTSYPLKSYFRLNPSGSVEDFLLSVEKGTNLGVNSMDLGEKYRRNFAKAKELFLLLSWGFPSPLPEPEWNGISLLISTGEKGLRVLEEVIGLLNQEPSKHIEILA